MSEQVKVACTTMMKGPGTGGHNRGVPAATPANDLAGYLEHLFARHGALETPAFSGPKQSHLTSKLKDRP